jgi:hypothetical protein
MESVGEMSWSELNALLLACNDEAQLSLWLKASLKQCKLTRVMRIYGRMSVVRRAREVNDILTKTRGA